jgi:hypothetical protein
VITMCDKSRVLRRDTECVVGPRGWEADAQAPFKCNRG